MQKVIFVTGGVVSSLGKGLVTASISAILKSCGYSVLTKKIDPYLNVDSGTLSPFEHGEVFVTYDGGETDLDLGHYERFTNIKLNKSCSITAGKIYWNVLNKERKGVYGGKTIQIIPHITDEISQEILYVGDNGENYDFIVVEVGGTVGDLESEVFLQTIMHMRSLRDKAKTMIFHTSLLPKLDIINEIKTKPTQHSVAHLHVKGIHPDVIILRHPKPICREESKEVKKISYLTGVKEKNIFISYNVDNIYALPIIFNDQGMFNSIIDKFQLNPSTLPNLELFKTFQNKFEKTKTQEAKKVALIGKYSDDKESYLSIVESISIASIYQEKKVKIDFINAQKINETNFKKILNKYDGILVAPGFGKRGYKGKLLSCKFAREEKVPFLGICFGMQIAIIEFLRNVGNLNKVTSKEFVETKNNIEENNAITILEGREPEKGIGGTLRLGEYNCKLISNTKTKSLYNMNEKQERHRHRYEVNPNFIELLKKNGMTIAGVNEKLGLVEIIEITNHPFYIGCQFHPEFETNIRKVHPLFKGFINAL